MIMVNAQHAENSIKSNDMCGDNEIKNNNCLLRISNVSKSFQATRALSSVSFEVMKSEIHALVGENGAGKSTLMNIIAGVLQADEGEITLNGHCCNFSNPKEAQMAGVSLAHQELAICNSMTVAENIFIDRAPTNKFGFIDKKRLHYMASELLEKFRCYISPDICVSDLNVAELQIVELAKALSFDCRLLILDEPTSSLTEKEADVLFSIIRMLKDHGVSILYITHRLSEIFTICDRVTILRDGQYIKTVDVTETSPHEIVCSMVGRELSNYYPDKSPGGSRTVFEVKGFARGSVFKDINFAVRDCEILGIYGLIGAGRTELARAICQIDAHDSGDVFLDGRIVTANNYKQSIEQGICYLTEDRKLEGLFLYKSIIENVNAASLERVAKNGIIQSFMACKNADEYIRNLRVKSSDNGQWVNNLSGGNQQKVLISKWLSAKPRVIFMDEPTRGVDVGAKLEIHTLLRQLANDGMTIILISSELPEIIGMCDRVLVMNEGLISGEASGNDLNEETLAALASGQHVNCVSQSK